MHEDRIRQLQKQVDAFGNVRSPLTQLVGEERIVVAGSQLLAIPSRWSFHEFLISYGRAQLGSDWIAENKALADPHPLVAQLAAGSVAAHPTGRAEVAFVELNMTADLYAFISFAYDLFTVADNARMQSALLGRIRHIDLYQGARYELFVAASLLRGGFKIEFADEHDSSRSHCEFAATHRETGRTFR